MPTIKRFILIDKSPCEISNTNNEHFSDIFCKCYGKKNLEKQSIRIKDDYLYNLKYNAMKEDFTIKKITSNGINDQITFLFNDQEIIYFTNISIPDDIEYIKDYIYDFNNLIILDHNPHSIIINYTDRMINFWGINTINYNDESIKNKKESICYLLNYDNFNYRFRKYNIISKNNKNEIANSWYDFLKINKKSCFKKNLIPLNKNEY